MIYYILYHKICLNFRFFNPFFYVSVSYVIKYLLVFLRSRTRNLMWYGVLGGKELLHRTFKNLEQRVQLECDGRRIPLPSLQGIVVLNIPRYV